MNGTYQPHFQMTSDDTYTNWFSPASGFTVTDSVIMQIEQNIYYIYLDGEFSTNAITANGEVSIGSYISSYFGGKPLSGYAPAHVTKTGESAIYSAVIQFFTSGGITVRGSTGLANHVRMSGLVIRREVN